MNAKSFNVGGKTYNCAMASAVAQDELLSLLSRHLFVASGLAKQRNVRLEEDSVLIMMTALDKTTKDRVSEILTERVFDASSQVQVSVKDFGGHIVDWNRLLSKLLVWNLADFFDLLNSVETNASQATGA